MSGPQMTCGNLNCPQIRSARLCGAHRQLIFMMPLSWDGLAIQGQSAATFG
jgi:hypothetical protein